jgi:uncharacterized membrane protein
MTAAYKALTSLKELDSQKRLRVAEAVVVERGEDGQVVEKDRVETTSGANGPSQTGSRTGSVAPRVRCRRRRWRWTCASAARGG